MAIRRAIWFAVLAGLLFAGSGAARFVHLRSAHVEDAHASAANGAHCHHHHTSPADPPDRPAHSSDNCDTCFLIAAAQKGVAALPPTLPLSDDCVVERHAVASATVAALHRLDAAMQRGPPMHPA